MNTPRLAVAFASLAIAVSTVNITSAQEAKPAAPSTQPATRPATTPKPLSKNVGKGLAWLAETQHKDGSWGQGEESRNMGNDQAKLKDSPNVADTCMAALALLRSGSTPRSGDYKANVLLAVNFVCSEVEASDEASISVTKTVGTRTQQKLGTHIDTFLAARLLAEVKD